MLYKVMILDNKMRTVTHDGCVGRPVGYSMKLRLRHCF